MNERRDYDMKILICYNSHNESNSIASATMAEYKKENPKNFKW